MSKGYRLEKYAGQKMDSKEESNLRKDIVQNIQPEMEDPSSVEAAFSSTSLAAEETSIDNEVLNLQKEVSVQSDKILAKGKIAAQSSIHFEDVVNSIESAFPSKRPLESAAFPHPRNWLGPRFMAIWSFPIIAINKLREIVNSTNPVRPYQETEYTITKAETIFTASQKVFKGSSPIRFFGPLFLSIWVLPFAITGVVMEILFVGPLKGTSPFG